MKRRLDVKNGQTETYSFSCYVNGVLVDVREATVYEETRGVELCCVDRGYRLCYLVFLTLGQWTDVLDLIIRHLYVWTGEYWLTVTNGFETGIPL